MRKKKKKYSLTAEVLREEHRLLNGQGEFFADVEKGIWDKFVEEHKEQIAQAIRDCAAFAAPEQPLGTVAEPADPPPASEFPPKTGKAKIKVNSRHGFFCFFFSEKKSRVKVQHLFL